MKKYAKKLTLSITASVLLASLLLPSAFAADVVSGGLTWTSNKSVVASPGKSKWSVANATCNALTAQGLPAGSWRLPTKEELSALSASQSGTRFFYTLRDAGWAFDWTWTNTAANSIADHHFVVNLSNGEIDGEFNNNYYYVSCVR
jgi:hypothetical protein